MDQATRGEMVIVRCWRNEASVLRVWDSSRERVELAPADEYEALSKGRSVLFPVSFPRCDVFRFDALALNGSGPVDFSRLEPY